MNNSFKRLLAQYGDAQPGEAQETVQPIAETAAPAPEAAEPTAEAPEQTQDAPESDQTESVETVPAAPSPLDAFAAVLQAQSEAIAQLSRSIAALDQRITDLSNAVEAVKQCASAPADGVKQLSAQMDELKQGFSRQEKANIDILRDSKNFQASVREQMQRDLDRYNKMHSETANAPLFTEIANLYVMSAKAISYLENEREKKNISEIVLDGMQEFLEDQGVAISSTPVGERRSVKNCKTRKTVPTPDPALHGMVAASLNPSFVLGNQVLIKENVDTYIYDESLANPAEEEAAQTSEAPAESVEPAEIAEPVENQEITETISGEAAPEA